MSIDTTWTK